MANSTDDPTSRYVQGGTTDKFQRRLGWWEKRAISQTEEDVEITLDKEFDKRPDKLAQQAYGKQSYMWFILQYNNILDPNEEFVAGRTIRLPLPNRVLLDVMSQQTGGNEV